MGWETRGSSKYFYKSIRDSNGPRKLYCGSGAAARAHEIRDRQMAIAKAPARELRRVLREGDRLWRETESWLRLLADSQLVLVGWYRHRGQWRQAKLKPRTRQTRCRTPVTVLTDDPKTYLKALVIHAEAGVGGAVEALQSFLDQHPEIWQTVEDLNLASLSLWTTQREGDVAFQPNVRNVVMRRAELAGSAASVPIVMALADAVVVAEMNRTYVDSVSENNASGVAVAFMMKRLEQADNRIRTTMRMLTRVQKTLRSQQVPLEPQVPDLPWPEEQRSKTA